MKAFFTLLGFTAATLFIKPAAVHAQAANVTDSLALADLYDSTNGTGWAHHDNWLTGPVSSWYGITLDADGRVTQVSLKTNKLTGAIPASFGNLLRLQYLYLDNNHLNGPIPITFNNFNRILGITLGGNYFTFAGFLQLSQEVLSYITFGKQAHLALHAINNNNQVVSAPSGGHNGFDWLYNGKEIADGNATDTRNVFAAGTYTARVTDSDLPPSFQLNTDNITLTPTADLQDSMALITFFDSTNGPAWTDRTGWRTLAPLKTWKGITLDSVARVSGIALPSNNLKGSLTHSQLNTLSDVKQLILNDNQLYGEIPPLPDLGVLENINMSHNNFTDFFKFDLSRHPVKTIDFSYNQLAYAIFSNGKSAILSSSTLEYLYLDHNNLIGADPFTEQYPNIKVYDISYNAYLFDDNITTPISPNLLSIVTFQPQQLLNVNFNQHKLSVNAGGRLGYNDYAWHKGSTLVQTVIGDSTFLVTEPGKYWVSVTNERLNSRFTLFSDTFEVTADELPVSLVNFTGQLTHNQAFLNWQTATELNSAYFGVQRSIDGTNFTTVGKVTAAGTSTLAQNYTFTDVLTGLTAMPAQLYYRLQQVDKDGKQSMSKTIVLTPAPGGSSSLIMYPNPVRSILNLRLKDIPGNAAITITGAGGKTLLAQTAKTVTGGQTISLNTSRLAAGVYIVHVQYNGQSEEQKFVKE